jgi:hypothetical protein
MAVSCLFKNILPSVWTEKVQILFVSVKWAAGLLAVESRRILSSKIRNKPLLEIVRLFLGTPLLVPHSRSWYDHIPCYDIVDLPLALLEGTRCFERAQPLDIKIFDFH